MIIKIIVCAVVSYLIGSISFSVLLSRRLGKDVRTQGSGNAGSTNMIRAHGLKYGLITFVLDVAKGFIPVTIASLWIGDAGIMASSLAVIIGHNWPVFFGFKGGKGVATSVGAVLAFMPVEMAIVLTICILIVVFTKTVSVASLFGAITMLVLGIVNNTNAPVRMVTIIIIVAFLVFQHRSNIVRLVKKKENKISLK